MRNFFRVNLGVIILTGVLMMSCAHEGRYSVYRSQKPGLGFEWTVPFDWARQEFGAPLLGFAGVTFMEKKQGPEIYRANFVVTAKKAAAFKLPSPTLEAVTEDTVQRCLKLNNARILKRDSMSVAGIKGSMIELTYRGLSHIYTPGSKEVPLHQVIIIVPHRDAFYIIRYINEENKFSSLDAVFRHALKTFRFVEPA